MARKRRGRGEGLIRQRDDGSWEARVSIGYDDEGRRIRKSVYGKTKGEVQEKLRKLQSDAAGGTLAEPSTLTVGQYLDAWMKDTAKAKCSPTTYERYESLVRIHIKPHIGGIKLQKLQALQVTHLMGEIARAIEKEDKERSPAWTQKMTLTLLGNALRHAVHPLRLIPYNPCTGIAKAKPGDKEMHFLTAEESKQFLAANVKRRLYALFVLALGTGMRQGEMLGLKWDAIDFDREQLTVRHSLAEVKGVFILKEPKSKRSRRTVKLPTCVVEALRNHRIAMQKEGLNSPFVFMTKKGTHITKTNLTRQVFRPALKAAKLKQIRFHDLRHSHASMLLNAGASIKAVSHRLGHSSVELTLRTYTHCLPDADDTLAAQTNGLLG